MTYQEALDWIHGQLKFGIKPGLERMAWMLKELGNPQDNLKAVHIVGTNGKGSTVNALQTIFTQAGYEVGTFTSPYIIDFKERISLNGQMISEEDLLDLVNRVKPVVERLPKETEHENATEFEIITVLMFLYFGQVHPVDIAFIEAGMGRMGLPLFMRLIVLMFEMFSRRRRVKKGLRPMSWGETSQLKGQAIPLILPMESKG